MFDIDLLFSTELPLEELRFLSIYPMLLYLKNRASKEGISGAYKGEKLKTFLSKLATSRSSHVYEELRYRLSKIDGDKCIYYGLGTPPWDVPQYFRNKNNCTGFELLDTEHPLTRSLIKLGELLEGQTEYCLNDKRS